MDAKQLYDELNRIWSSLHNDSTMEMNEAEADLREAIGRGYKPELIKLKMHQYLDAMKEDGVVHKARLSIVIKNKFWEKQWVPMVEYKRFKVEGY